MSNENSSLSKELAYLYEEIDDVEIKEKFDLKTNEAMFLSETYSKNHFKLIWACFKLGYSRGNNHN